ncbi:MAG: PIN domain-containing protein [Prevotella sp.]|nr:PIN domain-containing protein [Prevotella sp.]
MRIFLDTNILLDLLEDRGGFTKAALNMTSYAISNQDTLLITDLSVVNASYIGRKATGKARFIMTFSAIRDFFEIIDVGGKAIDSALVAGWKAFEDTVQYFAAVNSKADALTTRNKKDYINSHLPVYTSKEYLNQFQA